MTCHIVKRNVIMAGTCQIDRCKRNAVGPGEGPRAGARDSELGGRRRGVWSRRRGGEELPKALHKSAPVRRPGHARI